MACRKWIVRSLVLAMVATLAAGALLYQHWTNPVSVRRQVFEKFLEKFPGASITLESARMRLLGGIVVNELRMVRRDDSDNTVFLYVPTAILYHDKERLLQGKLAIRKIEMERPRLRLRRERDGTWNLSGVLAPPDLTETIPTILACHATILIEDRQNGVGTPPLEIKNVNLKILNDPERTVTFEGTGLSEALGNVQVGGTWQRDTSAATLSFQAPAVPVKPALIQRLEGFCPQAVEHARGLSGNGALRADFRYQPDKPRPWFYDVQVALSQGRFNHSKLPVPLENLEGSFQCIDGRIPRLEVKGSAGPAALRLTASDLTMPEPCPTKDPCDSLDRWLRQLHIRIENLAMTRGLFNTLSEKNRDKCYEIFDDFLPGGSFNVTFEMYPEGKGNIRQRLLLEPQEIKATFVRFPYTLERITGTIDYRSFKDATEEAVDIDLTGYAGHQPIRIKGRVRGERPNHTADLDIWGQNIPLDEKLLLALKAASPASWTLARSFHPTGLGDFYVRSHRDPQVGRYLNRYRIAFHQATVCYEIFPYKLENVAGVLDIHPDQTWAFHDFRGTHGSGVFFTSGRCLRREDGDHVQVEIVGRHAPLHPDLQEALPPELQRLWNTLNPTGSVDFDGTLAIPPQPPDAVKVKPDVDLVLQPRGCTIQPAFFGYRLDDLHGKVHYAGNRVELENMTARHGPSRVHLDKGVVELKPQGGFRADLTYLHAQDLAVDADLLKALREPLRKGLAAVEVHGPLEVHTRLYVDDPAGTEPPRIFWDGSVVLRDAALRTGVPFHHVQGTVASRGWFNGTHLDNISGNLDIRQAVLFNQPIHNIRGEILVSDDEPDVLKLPGLMAELFGGRIYGPARVEFGPKLHYELDLTATQVRLEEFGRHNFGKATDFNGLAVGRLFLKGDGADLNGLRGSGRLDVPNGKMYNLPLLLDLLKFLGLRLPDRTAFEEAHATFDIEGLRAHVRQLELYGNAISLRGKGDLNLDGSDLNLDFHVDWARLGQLLPPGIRNIPREISNQLLKIEMRGRVGEVRFNKQPVPLLTDPLKKLLGPESGTRRATPPATSPGPKVSAP